MQWFYNKDGEGVMAEKQPDGYHYDFRGASSAVEPEATEEELEQAIELEELKTRYMEKFGRKPHGKVKRETLIKALEDDS